MDSETALRTAPAPVTLRTLNALSPDKHGHSATQHQGLSIDTEPTTKCKPFALASIQTTSPDEEDDEDRASLGYSSLAPTPKCVATTPICTSPPRRRLKSFNDKSTQSEAEQLSEEEKSVLPPVRRRYVLFCPSPSRRYHRCCTATFLRQAVGFHGLVEALLGVAALTWFFLHGYRSAAVVVLAVALASYLRTNLAFQQTHMAEDAVEQEAVRAAANQLPGSAPFLTRRVSIRPHRDRPGKKVWVPSGLKEDDAIHRGFAALGMPRWAYLRDLLTYALEYKVQALWRMIQVDLGLGRHGTSEATRSTVYQTVMNSSLGCYLDARGHFVTYRTTLPFNGSELKEWYNITVELDHKRQVGVRMLLQEHQMEPNSQESGPRDEGLPVTEDRATIIVVHDPTEIAAFLCAMGSLKSHVHVHWWANGVAETTHFWAFARESAELVQGFNSAAVHSTENVFRNTAKQMAEMLYRNATEEGLPVHGDIAHLSERSVFHQLSASARKALSQLLPAAPRYQLEALIAATVIHAADHYLPDCVLPYRLYSEVLRTDFTIPRATVFAAIRYRSRRFLCKENLHDPVCAALYRACWAIDPVFADNYLCVGVAA